MCSVPRLCPRKHICHRGDRLSYKMVLEVGDKNQSLTPRTAIGVPHGSQDSRNTLATHSQGRAGWGTRVGPRFTDDLRVGRQLAPGCNNSDRLKYRIGPSYLQAWVPRPLLFLPRTTLSRPPGVTQIPLQEANAHPLTNAPQRKVKAQAGLYHWAYSCSVLC